MFRIFDLLLDDPLGFLEFSLYRIPAVLIALILHECAHGYAAYRLGDDTAKRMGRLTLNPLAHLDPVGLLMMIFCGFGWAKPVPINPCRYRRPRRDDFIVSLAGITTNFLLFFVGTIALVYLNSLLWKKELLEYYSLSEMLGVRYSLLNGILNGSGNTVREYMARPGLLWAVRFLGTFTRVNLSLALFNLLPVPPLDGSHVLNDLLLKRSLFASRRTANIGTAILMVLSFTGVLGEGLSFVQGIVVDAVLSLLSIFQ